MVEILCRNAHVFFTVIATQQRMSDKERWRREITGSLSAAAVSNAVKSMGLVEKMSTSPQSSNSKSHNISFAVEGNSKYFQLPSVFEMNLVTDKRTGKHNFCISSFQDIP